MSDRLDPAKISKVRPELEKPAFSAVSAKPDLSTDLNIVLSKHQIDTIMKELIEASAFIDPGSVALASDYCCVDASVGSSVAGPFSSVGSSVSVDPNMKAARITERLTADKLKVNIMLPEKVSIK